MAVLVALSYSPWSEKARWALDHHRVPYREVEYVPMLGAPLLRVALRDFHGPVTVPVLFYEGGAFRDSYDIARFAEREGAGAPLFPSGSEAAVTAWNADSETLMAHGRALSVSSTAKDRDALAEALPGFLPAVVRPALRPLAALGTRYIARKYVLDEHGLEEHRAAIRDVLDRLRAALGGRATLLDGFSYADVAMAAALQFVRPVSGRYVPLGAATRLAWTRPRLAEDYADLLDWRDRTYERFRRGR